jgi:hypothetical protein
VALRVEDRQPAAKGRTAAGSGAVIPLVGIGEAEARLVEVDERLAAASARQAQLRTRRATLDRPGGDSVELWKLDDELEQLDQAVEQLQRERQPLARRVALHAAAVEAQARGVREAEQRRQAVVGLRAQLEIVALLERIGAQLEIVREASRHSAAHLSYAAAHRQLEQTLARWRDVRLPQLTAQLDALEGQERS